MEKYVQVRYAPTSNYAKTVKHDLRKNKPNYLRDDLYHNQFLNALFMPKFVQTHRAENEVYKRAEKDFAERYKKRVGRNPQRGNASAFLTGIITLSNDIIDEIEEGEISKKQLDELFKKAVFAQLDEIERLTGVRPGLFYATVHYDETTPHVHFMMTNFDRDGKSIWHRLRTKEKLGRLQDRVGESFSHIGYVRGEKKEKTGATHKNIRQMHTEEMKELREHIKEIQEYKKQLKELISDTTELKDRLDEADEEIRVIRGVMKRKKNR